MKYTEVNNQYISLIVPTYNRSKYLKKSLQTFLQQYLDQSLYEIIIVDNNSNDHTQNVVSEIINNNHGRIRYFFEKRQGLHYARNRGILESTGNILVFGDDDIEADKLWLTEIWEAFQKSNNVGIAGGRVFPKWDFCPPEWIYDYGTPKVHDVFAYYDLGEQKKKIKPGDPLPIGCNFAIRKEIAEQIGGSPPDTFPNLLKYKSGAGESWIVMEVIKLGYDVIYLPDAFVYHHADASRASLEYFFDRYERWGIEEVFWGFKNTRSKLFATTKLWTRTFWLVLIALKKSNKKIHPQKYIRIHIRKWLVSLKQIFRVLCDKALYDDITKRNYLE